MSLLDVLTLRRWKALSPDLEALRLFLEAHGSTCTDVKADGVCLKLLFSACSNLRILHISSEAVRAPVPSWDSSSLRRMSHRSTTCSRSSIPAHLSSRSISHLSRNILGAQPQLNLELVHH